MAERGFSLEQGPVAVMLNDHKEGRIYVKGMSEGTDRYKNGEQGAIALIFQNMQGYIELLRSHISKENNILFRMADNALSDRDNETLLQAFAEVERNNRSGIDPSGFIGSIEFLAKIYLA